MASLTAAQALRLLERHGAMLQSARGPLPRLVDAIAGEEIRGSWWGHPRGRIIFAVLTRIDESGKAAACRLAGGKITLLHARIWPALFRLVPGPEPRLDRVREEHTASGAHRSKVDPWPGWLPAGARTKAKDLTEDEARSQLGDVAGLVLPPPGGFRSRAP